MRRKEKKDTCVLCVITCYTCNILLVSLNTTDLSFPDAVVASNFDNVGADSDAGTTVPFLSRADSTFGIMSVARFPPST